VKRPRTLAPDALAKKPAPLKIETVADEKVMTDKSMSMTLYSVPGDHTKTMLMAYFPRERLLVEADLYEPDEHIHMFAAGFLAEVRKRPIRVDRIVSLHSNPVPYAQLGKDVASMTSASK
jgi:hypothetical protein